MKKMLTLIILSGCVSSPVFAAANGLYVGVQSGYSDIGYSANDVTPSPTSVMYALNDNLVNSNNLGNTYDIQSAAMSPSSFQSSSSSSDNYFGRVFLGYQFNQYLALETGYTDFQNTVNATANYTGAGRVSTGNVFVVYIVPLVYNWKDYAGTSAVNLSNQVSENVIDLNMKVMYPIPNSQLNIYTKLGVAFVDPTVTTRVTSATVNVPGLNSAQIITNPEGIASEIESKLGDEFCPEITPGISYDITNNISADVSWTFVKGEGSVKNINTANLGLTYHF